MPRKRSTRLPAKTEGAKPRRRWSQRVTESSDALDLEAGVFTLDDPREIALSLKRSAESSSRRKASAFQAAMSMLTFYINRAGRRLSSVQRARLEAAKDELRLLYGRALFGRTPLGRMRPNHQDSGKSSGEGR